MIGPKIVDKYFFGCDTCGVYFKYEEFAMATVYEQFRNDVLSAMESERNNMPDPAGDTPVTRLSCRIEKLSGNEWTIAERVFADLIDAPPEGSEDDDAYWRGITFLAGYLKNDTDKINIRQACERRIFSDTPFPDNPKMGNVFAMYTYCGGLMSEESLSGRFATILSREPMFWLSVAVANGHTTLAEDKTVDLLRKGVIKRQEGLETLVLMLDVWADSWPCTSNFFDVARRFRSAVPDPEGKALFDRWLKRRGQE